MCWQSFQTATGAENSALSELVAVVDSTTLGRARLALAAGMKQFAPWTCAGSDEPALDDYDGQYAQLLCPTFLDPNFFFSNPIVVRAPIEELAGGIVSWNDDIHYTEMLARSGRKDFVEAMYAKAGASLQADLRTLAKAPRISADPEAVKKTEKLMSYTGEVGGPVVNVDNIGAAGWDEPTRW